MLGPARFSLFQEFSNLPVLLVEILDSVADGLLFVRRLCTLPKDEDALTCTKEEDARIELLCSFFP